MTDLFADNQNESTNGQPFDFFTEVPIFLDTWRTASLATIDENSRPHAANVQFACRDIEHLYFVSSPDSAHSQHLIIEPRIAMTIHAYVDAPELIHGVQLHGRCTPVTDDKQKQIAWDCYTAAFPFILSNPAIEQRVRDEQFYLVVPTWMRYIDNRRGFGFKVEQFFEV